MHIIRVGEYWINLDSIAYIEDIAPIEVLEVFFVGSHKDDDNHIILTDENREILLTILEKRTQTKL